MAPAPARRRIGVTQRDADAQLSEPRDQRRGRHRVPVATVTMAMSGACASITARSSLAVNVSAAVRSPSTAAPTDPADVRRQARGCAAAIRRADEVTLQMGRQHARRQWERCLTASLTCASTRRRSSGEHATVVGQNAVTPNRGSAWAMRARHRPDPASRFRIRRARARR